eukprot:6458272-Amphidinium_carterae.1
MFAVMRWESCTFSRNALLHIVAFLDVAVSCSWCQARVLLEALNAIKQSVRPAQALLASRW